VTGDACGIKPAQRDTDWKARGKEQGSTIARQGVRIEFALEPRETGWKKCVFVNALAS
jgi:hypothetical protein